ncbi:MAG: hypothetical protein JWM68_4182 [Verrucomicrobiales bacterium]|nr:hypothetical protein [Verrucomicrobiales bacterium]
MKKIITAASACLIMGIIVPAFAQAPPQPQQTQGQNQNEPQKVLLAQEGKVTVTATVQDVDYKTRHLTLKMPDGRTIRLKAGEEIPSFEKLKKGDKTLVDYYESTAIAVAKANEQAPPVTRTEIVLVPQNAEKPEEVKPATTQVRATVEDIDAKRHKLTVRDPDGKRVKLSVDPQVRDLQDLKKGDQIIATFTEGIAIAATPQ